jgi:hypothetical protein
MDPKKFFDTDLIRGTLVGALAGLVVLALVLHGRPGTSAADVPSQAVAQLSESRPQTSPPIVLPRRLDLGDAPASHDARRLARWVVGAADNGPLPFVILDKRDARVFVFAAEGRLLGSSPVLLGYARGDHSVPGIGERAIEHIRPEERTTPAGRFVSEPGRNHVGEEVVWVDYEAAVSMHRVRLTNPAERRAERLASPTADDNRISYGCINLPVEFFERLMWPTLRDRHGVVYVLPEKLTLERVFPGVTDSPEVHSASEVRR